MIFSLHSDRVWKRINIVLDKNIGADRISTHWALAEILVWWKSYDRWNSKTRTCVSGSSEPMLAAPSLTTSVSCVMVLAEEWAAWASLSWLDAAPDTSSLVSSTKALAVFNMFSLKCSETNTLQITQWDTQDGVDIYKTNLWHFMHVMLKLMFYYASPVVCERLFVLCVQCAGRGEHDGCVQISQDAGDRTGCSYAGLCSFITSLQGW